MEDQVYTFKVTLKFKKGIYRVIEVKGSSTLWHFAEAIVEAFDWQLDHAFGFYNSMGNTYNSTEAYTVFCDNRAKVMPIEKSVKKTHVNKVFQPRKKMMFLFDYGQEWHFVVWCLSVAEPKVGIEYPNITKRKGKAPPQYYDSNEDEDDDDE